MSDIIDETHDTIPQPGPRVEYEVTYIRKGKRVLIEDVRGFQFDSGFYFLFVHIEGMPAPQLRVLDLHSLDVRELTVTPIRIIKPDA